ncbi:hypothetical protein NBRC116493_10760 [Aurantivibrio infirmus]
MTEGNDYLEMTFRSIDCFANDGRLDVDELNQILDIALRDGMVDENEKRVLRNIISRLTTKDLTASMKVRVGEISQQLDL